MKEQLHTSESVTEGHPDKVCDQIAATILDEAIIASNKLKLRPRVAMEVSAKGSETNGGTLMLFGEVTLPQGITLDYADIAKNTLERIGYTDPSAGFSSHLHELFIRITQQSANIDGGVSRKRTGAGDQGLMFGAATDETPELMPMPIAIAHRLTNGYTELYRDGLPYLRPDGKAQVVLVYKNGKPVDVHKIILAASHDPLVDMGQLRQDLLHRLIIPTLDYYSMHIDRDDQIVINGAGPWTIYGPIADAGTTNRKIIVDSYGGAFGHGGGGFNGKDPTKVDLSGACGARYVAKGLVAEQLASRVQIEVSYVIGQPDPLQIDINTFNPEETRHKRRIIESRAKELLDLSVDSIIDGLNLFQPVYAQASVGGFFGREIFPWEQIPSR